MPIFFHSMYQSQHTRFFPGCSHAKMGALVGNDEDNSTNCKESSPKKLAINDSMCIFILNNFWSPVCWPVYERNSLSNSLENFCWKTPSSTPPPPPPHGFQVALSSFDLQQHYFFFKGNKPKECYREDTYIEKMWKSSKTSRTVLPCGISVLPHGIAKCYDIPVSTNVYLLRVKSFSSLTLSIFHCGFLLFFLILTLGRDHSSDILI